jgi:hypothetical protein
MLIQVVHEVTSGLMKLDSSEEFRSSATILMFRASVTVLISTEGINKELLWFEILKYIKITPSRPLTIYKVYLNHFQSTYLLLLVSCQSVNISFSCQFIYHPSLKI